MNFNLKQKMDNAPKKPGCYLWRNNLNEIIYVGKAKNIYKRIHQYFNGPKDLKTSKLVNDINDVDFIEVNNENEALLLEANLIKKHKPRYNILLKDNNGYPYILITKEKYPRLLYTRNFEPKKGKYYGPFASSELKAYDLYNLLLKLFPLRNCFNKKKRKCEFYDLNLCMKACTHEVTDEDYEVVKKKIDYFFNNGADQVLDNLKQKEELASQKLDFELAKKYLDLQKAIKLIFDKQIINLYNNKERIDVLAYQTKDNVISIVLFSYVDGKLVSKNSLCDFYYASEQEVLTSYITQYYKDNIKPKTLYVSLNEENAKLLENSLAIELINPVSGKMYEIMYLALQNVSSLLDQKYESLVKKERSIDQALDQLKDLLKLDKLNLIEVYDNSNLFNTDKVSAMVVFENKKFNKKKYRKYKIKDNDNQGDYHYMYEVLYRRLYSCIKNNLLDLADLIILDGGKLQVLAAKKVINDLDLHNKVNVIGLAKNNKHQTDKLVDYDLNEYDLDKRSELYFFLANLQEEVHKFAISFFRKTKAKSFYDSILDDIKGLGKKRKDKLLEHFKSVDNIKKTSLENLSQVVPLEVAKNIKQKLDQQ
ncbi:excinuclease ABC subunit UvrC [Mycoplasma sp. T363T]|uniref:excinuclease ABC subunit UvrC n=1 Tax=Mycoplasma bradburyae TaxID=2963128 RepID=UPI0023409A3C|nr:excinuclease ABC subunit UvrC [Mycoplasma bradburyae]MDC4163686.1 excinuclease ABC subunit UvrC [Mycoplasma bradburyae]